MEDLKKIFILNEVNEVLKNHIGVNSETLAEFVLAMAKGKTCPAELGETLEKHGVELSSEFIETLFYLIHRLQNHKLTIKRTNDISAQLFDNNVSDKEKEEFFSRKKLGRLNNTKRNFLANIWELQLGAIYEGRVEDILENGFLIEFLKSDRIRGFLDRRNTSIRGCFVHQSLQKGDSIWVKVLSITGSHIYLSLDNDYNNRLCRRRLRTEQKSFQTKSTMGKNNFQTVSNKSKRQNQNINSPDVFDLGQMIASGVMTTNTVSNLDPMIYSEQYFDEFNNQTEDFEVDINEQEPNFLKAIIEKSTDQLTLPLMVRAPDGSLNRSAMTGSALAKERRELKEQQERQKWGFSPIDLLKPWEDPTTMTKDRHLASEFYGMHFYSDRSKDEKNFTKTFLLDRTEQKSIKEQREGLPIFSLRNDFINAVKKHQIIVTIGETGSGKTTQITQYLAESGFANDGSITCTQPRRVAAQSIAKRVAEEVGCRLGEEVGYNVRFDDCTSAQTKIKYMTDGMLLRDTVTDSEMSKYKVIILDEAHERTTNTDVLFGVLKGLSLLRSDLKLIVTSATLDAEKFSTYFFTCPIFTIKGKMYPVEKFYSKRPEIDYLEASLTTVLQIHLTEPEGDILLFLTGQEEIETACQILQTRIKALGTKVPELLALPVYSALPAEVQSQIFDRAPPGCRKCVIATNIAETSITIDGIYYVIDPGMSKISVFAPRTGMDSLLILPISQASANQRAGRAGRTGPGKCFRLYLEEAYKHEMIQGTIPEIQRCNLGMIVLTLKAIGINELLKFDFMDPPPHANLIHALELLYHLGGLDDEGLLTRLGRRMADFPLDPSMSKVLLTSVDLGCSDEITTIMAMLQVQNVFYRPKNKQGVADEHKARFFQSEGDHFTLLAVYTAWKRAKYSQFWCHENFILIRALTTASETRKQVIGIMERHNLTVVSANLCFTQIQKAITSGYFFHVARKDSQDGYKSLVEQQVLYIHPSSTLFQSKPECVIYHTSTVTNKEYMREVVRINSNWLIEMAPNFFRPADLHKLSRRKRFERLEPLYDRYHDPKVWRLSRRRG
eukprot:gnl/MRDRNA2_/MRDRNA2_86177_c0_seq1.p1 gnl/MRDRNA2_/MRDRNA2_86177_c0~~gnl/MRDRNA2_/MRDRNA2_86177_c0_seq1.p1  ORF type:complete len:1064 (+),score=24.62 gnl/MRDRNA2_/MRDRNA2_86177_c0_seq1:50-3241(+)